MELTSVLKRKLYAAFMTIVLSTITTYFYFVNEIDKSILWIVFLVYAAAILTYGMAVSIFSEYISSKINHKFIAFISRFLIHIIFGATFFIGGFIILYGLTASIIFFVLDELLRYKQIFS
jgi:hypothetical protein